LASRNKIGEIIKVSLPKGHAYLQYLGQMREHHAFSVFAVFDGTFTEDLSIEQITERKIAYCFASEITEMLRHRAFKLVGMSKTNVPRIPAFREGFYAIVEDGEKRPIRGYSDGLQDMAISVAVPMTAIIDRLQHNWRPRHEFARTELAFEQKGRKFLRTGLYWLTFDSETDLEAAKQALTAEGFHVERVDIPYGKLIQLKASKFLGDDLLASRDVFSQLEDVVRDIAGSTNGKNLQSMVE